MRTTFHFTRVRCTTLWRWHFEIYFSLRKTFPCLSLSQCCALRLTGCSLGSTGWFERKFASASSFLPSLHLQKARWPGMWESHGEGGTRLCHAMEMAVSIKYHFQFPCFMIPGLLTTNNPPSAGPPTLSWRRLITLVASYKKDIYMKIRKQLLCLHGSESRTKAIPNLIFIQRRGKITISWRLISVSFGCGGGKDVCRLNKAGKLFSCNVDGCCLHPHNEDVADSEAEIALDMSVTHSLSHVFLHWRLILYTVSHSIKLSGQIVVTSLHSEYEACVIFF